jgi:hypothetical protein
MAWLLDGLMDCWMDEMKGSMINDWMDQTMDE